MHSPRQYTGPFSKLDRNKYVTVPVYSEFYFSLLVHLIYDNGDYIEMGFDRVTVATYQDPNSMCMP